MTVHTGVVEAVSTKYDKYSVLVNGGWYGSKDEYTTVRPNKGDTIEFDDGGKKYLQKVKVLGGGGPVAPVTSTPEVAGGKDRMIIRQNALTNAREAVAPVLRDSLMDQAVDGNVNWADVAAEVITVARMFEAYTSGELDKEEAEEATRDAFRPE